MLQAAFWEIAGALAALNGLYILRLLMWRPILLFFSVGRRVPPRPWRFTPLSPPQEGLVEAVSVMTRTRFSSAIDGSSGSVALLVEMLLLSDMLRPLHAFRPSVTVSVRGGMRRKSW